MLSHHRAAVCLVGLLVLFAGGVMSLGQGAPPEDDGELLALDARVGQFLDSVSMGETEAAYRELLADSRLMEQEKALEELREQTRQLHTKYGGYRNFEQVAAKRIGDDLVLMRYLYKCTDFPVVWYFTFYRTPPGATAADEGPLEKASWRIVTVRFDTELEGLAW